MSKLIEYLLERHQVNTSGCHFTLKKDNVKFVEYFNGERVSDINLTPEEFKTFSDRYYGQEKNDKNHKR